MELRRCWINPVGSSVASISMRMSKEDYMRSGMPSIHLDVTELPTKENPQELEMHLVFGLLSESSLEMLRDKITEYLENQ